MVHISSFSTPNFPIIFEDSQDDALFWTREAAHFPNPLTPIDFLLGAQVIYKNMDKAFEFYDMPFRQKIRHINTYLYLSVVCLGTRDEILAKSEKYQQRLKSEADGLAERWEKEWLPEIKNHLVYWEACNLSSLSVSELLLHLDETLKRQNRSWEIHFLLYYPMVYAANIFEETYLEFFSDSPIDVYELLTGYDNKNTESTKMLWNLSRRALELPEVRNALTSENLSDIIGRLETFSEGCLFLTELNAYLQEYVKRTDSLYLSDPYWTENPMPVIKNLKDYINQPESVLNKDLKKMEARRQQHEISLKKALTGYPEPVIKELKSLLSVARQCHIIREDHNHWIDYLVSFHVRKVILECGKRLTDAGLICSISDVFYLTPDELKKALHGCQNSDSTRECQSSALMPIIEKRRSEEKYFASVTPPAQIGSSPPDFFLPDDALIRAFFKIDGVGAPVSENPSELRGFAGSPGVAQGTARIICSLFEAEKLMPGEILIADAAMPAWTPFFANIAALITNTGGILSHGAIVAREYGIPAVVGTGKATSVIKDGQRLEVDGNAGIVRII